MNVDKYQIPADRRDRFTYRGVNLCMPRMAKAKTMLVGNPKRLVAICTGWDDPELILSDEIVEEVIMAAPIRSTYGINILLGNLALNPQIEKIIFVRGGEYDETATGQLPKNIIDNLWKNGVDDKGKVIGTSFSLSKELVSPKGIAIINEIRQDVQLIDWFGKDDKKLVELLSMIKGLAKTKRKREVFEFPDFTAEEIETWPSERTAFEIRGSSGIDSWLKLIDRIIRYGQTATLETKEGTLIRELPFERITLEGLEKQDFPVPKWIENIPEVKINQEELEAYYQRFIRPDTYYVEIYPGVKKFIRPPTDKYLYCELLFAFPRPVEINKATEYILSKYGIVAVKGFLQEKFPGSKEKDALADRVISDKKLDEAKKTDILLEVYRPPFNQIVELQKRLKEIPSDADKTLILWDPNVHSLAYSGRPCWVEAAALVRGDEINFKAVFRSHDIAKGWIKNVYGIYRLVKDYFCQPTGLKMGTITIESESGHIYLADLTWVKKVWQEQVGKIGLYQPEEPDKRGNVLISVVGKEIEVVVASPEDGKPFFSVKGKPMDIYYQIISHDMLGAGGHWAYLGKELGRAESCIKTKIPYIQDKA